ncbi:MAG: helix-turn-helix transcriptional regulator [Bdellovibrionota bacterium]
MNSEAMKLKIRLRTARFLTDSRRRAGFDIETARYRLGYSSLRAITDLETGSIPLPLSEIGRIARVYEISEEDLARFFIDLYSLTC